MQKHNHITSHTTHNHSQQFGDGAGRSARWNAATSSSPTTLPSENADTTPPLSLTIPTATHPYPVLNTMESRSSSLMRKTQRAAYMVAYLALSGEALRCNAFIQHATFSGARTAGARSGASPASPPAAVTRMAAEKGSGMNTAGVALGLFLAVSRGADGASAWPPPLYAWSVA